MAVLVRIRFSRLFFPLTECLCSAEERCHGVINCGTAIDDARDNDVCSEQHTAVSSSRSPSSPSSPSIFPSLRSSLDLLSRLSLTPSPLPPTTCNTPIPSPARAFRANRPRRLVVLSPVRARPTFSRRRRPFARNSCVARDFHPSPFPSGGHRGFSHPRRLRRRTPVSCDFVLGRRTHTAPRRPALPTTPLVRYSLHAPVVYSQGRSVGSSGTPPP